MFPNYDKCIYIDADTVIPGDISRLYNEDLGNNYLGCIVDKSTIDNEILASYFEEVVGIPRDKYINSGVLLMNSKKLRELKIDEKNKFIDTLTNFKVSIEDTKGYLDAQVTSGGVSLEEINLETMESKLVKNLYFAGEVLDLDGDCGGYNLTISFITGLIAGDNHD